MPHRTPRLAALALAGVVLGVALAACQDYNFSPVRYCLIQPGTERVTLSDISSADLLFVVDDSGSMGGEQLKLAESFDAFVNALKASNVERVAALLQPIDFHIAVTTSSVFQLNQPETAVTCSSACGGAVGRQVCCRADNSQPLQAPRGCATLGATPTDCTSGQQCRDDCLGRHGEKTCCSGTDKPPETVAVTCTTPGAACGDLKDRYVVGGATRVCKLDGTPQACSGKYDGSCPVGFTCKESSAGAADWACRDANRAHACAIADGFTCRTDCVGMSGGPACCNASKISQVIPACDIGVGEKNGLYPRGDFVASRKADGTRNQRVIHFDKGLFCAAPSLDSNTCNALLAPPVDPPAPAKSVATTISERILAFQQNVAVGTCGSGQEQGLEAGRRGIQKALDGTQPPETGTTTPPAWPRPLDASGRATSKMVVVFVGDEDDCSGPEDVTGGIIFSSSGSDACVADAALPLEQQRLTKLQEYVDFLAGLGRPVAGAFIVSARSETCADAECQADICCDSACAGAGQCTLAGVCGGQGAGYRFLDLDHMLNGRNTETVTGSVCNPGSPLKPGFSSILERVAEVVKQPIGLKLPTQPAAAPLTLLRIAGADGKTRKTCNGPAPAASPPPTTPADIAAAVAAAEAAAYDWWFTGGDDTNRAPTGPSKFVYLNKLPGNCVANPGETYSADYLGLVPASGCGSPADCQSSLGGKLEDWSCCAGFDQAGACLAPTVVTRGSCLCGGP